MKKITSRQKALQENPFYGKSELLTLSTQIHKLEADVVDKNTLNRILTSAWDKCKTEDEKALFWIIVFSAGDISNRDHNLFRKLKVKAEGGGNSARNVFYLASVWALSHSKETQDQWYSFLDLIPEYTNWENLFYNGVKTDRKTGKILEKRELPIDVKKIAKYLAKIIKNPKTPEVTHAILAKYLDKPRTSARQKKVTVTDKNKSSLEKATKRDLKVGEVVNMKRSLQEQTLKVMNFKAKLATELSKLMKWEVIEYPKNVRFVGLEQYKAQWNRRSESYLFSSKDILKFDEVEFVQWIDTLPSSARYRVQCRLLNKDGNKLITTGKWVGKNGDLANWYLNWLDSKEKAQQKLRDLTPEQKREMTVKELKEVEKAAKVNTGATNLIDIVCDFFKANTEKELNVKAQSILDKIKIEVPVFVIADVSGSMSWKSVSKNGVEFSALNMAQLATTIFLLKNPNEEMSSMFMRFDNTAEMVTDGATGIKKKNRFMTGKEVKVNKLIDRKADFLTNFRNISQQIFARGGTNFASVVDSLKQWVDSDPDFKNEKIEIINQYPVWLVVSDGDMNNSYNANSSMQQFKMMMRQYFNWDGVVVVWDVKQVEDSINKFKDIDNVMYFSGFNASILNQVFTNLHDLDIIDVYTPLQSLFRSQRYAPIRDRVLNKSTEDVQLVKELV